MSVVDHVGRQRAFYDRRRDEHPGVRADDYPGPLDASLLAAEGSRWLRTRRTR